MKLNKNILPIIISLLTVALILTTGVAGAVKPSDIEIDKDKLQDMDLTIAFAQKTVNAPYFKAQVVSAREECEELGVNFVALDAKDSMVTQMNNIQNLISQGADAILINPKDPEGIVPATKLAAKAGIPVVVVDSAISSNAEFVSAINSNNHQNGEKVGRWIVDKANDMFPKEKLKIALISGNKGNLVGRTRRQGVFAGIAERQLQTQGQSSFEVVSQGWGGWQQAKGMQAMEDIVTAHPDLNVLLTENDSMALGAIKAMKAAGKEPMKDFIVAAAADGQKEALKLIKEGKYGATGLNNPALVTRTGVRVAVAVAAGFNEPSDFPGHMQTPSVAININNVDEYYNPDAVF